MGMTENFLVNAKNFESIIEELRTIDKLPARVTHQFLDSHGYSNPSDLLVLHLFKDLKMLQQDGSPTPLFEKFRMEATSGQALAQGIVEAYSGLFEINPLVYMLNVEELKEEIKKLFDSSKSDLILKYMANTFLMLVDYAGIKNVEEASEQFTGQSSGIGKNERPITEGLKNEDIPPENPEEEITADEDDQQIKKEEKGKAEIEEFIKQAIKPGQEEITEQAEPSQEPDDTEEDDEEESLLPGNKEKKDPFSEQSKPEGPEGTNNPFGFNNSQNTSNKSMEEDQGYKTDTGFIDKAFARKAELLYKLEKFEEALPAFKDVIDRFGDSDDPFFETRVSNAIVLRASILDIMKRYDEALPAYDEIIDRFEHSGNPEFYDHASHALIKKIEIMEMLELEKQLLPLYSRVIQRLGASGNPQYIKHVDKAYIKQVDILLESEQQEKTLKALDEVITRFNTSGREKEFLKKAMYKKAVLLEQMGQNEEALEAYETFLSTFR